MPLWVGVILGLGIYGFLAYYLGRRKGRQEGGLKPAWLSPDLGF